MIPEVLLERLARQVCNSTDPQPTAVLHGYTKGHAAITLQCLRETTGIKALFDEIYA